MVQLRIFVAAAMFVIVGAVPTASAEPSPSTGAVLHNVHQRAVFVAGVEEQVRPRVPAPFKLVRDPLGRPVLIIVAARAERYAVGDGEGVPTTFMFFAAIIESPDGSGCLSKSPVIGQLKPDVLPFCHLYNFYAAYNNRAIVDGVRALVPDYPIYYAPTHVYREQALDLTQLASSFHFRAGPGTEGPGTPAPFTMDGVTSEGRLEAPASLSPSTFTFWFPGPSGTIVGFRFEDRSIALGQMHAAVRAAPGSDMAALVGGPAPTTIVALANRYTADATFIPPRQPTTETIG